MATLICEQLDFTLMDRKYLLDFSGQDKLMLLYIYVIDIHLGLNYMLEIHNCIHRDIKLDNLMIKPDNNQNKISNYRIKIIDFSAVSKLDSNGYAASYPGTPYNMAPERHQTFINQMFMNV